MAPYCTKFARNSIFNYTLSIHIKELITQYSSLSSLKRHIASLFLPTVATTDHIRHVSAATRLSFPMINLSEASPRGFLPARFHFRPEHTSPSWRITTTVNRKDNLKRARPTTDHLLILEKRCASRRRPSIHPFPNPPW